MTDQIPADKVREIIDAHRDGASRRAGVILAALEALLPTPPRPTLADMTAEDRDECQWMQADTERWGHAVIVRPDVGGGRAALLDGWGHMDYGDHADVTPRPDLPRMEWPGTEKPAPAPALPEGWRLATHPHHGRVIVTRTEPDRDGEVAITVPVPTEADRARLEWCRPDELTYIDTEPEEIS